MFKLDNLLDNFPLDIIKKWMSKCKHHVQWRTVIWETNKGTVIRLSVYIQVFSLLPNKGGSVVWNLFCVKWLNITPPEPRELIQEQSDGYARMSKNLLVIVIMQTLKLVFLGEQTFPFIPWALYLVHQSSPRWWILQMFCLQLILLENSEYIWHRCGSNSPSQLVGKAMKYDMSAFSDPN